MGLGFFLTTLGYARWRVSLFVWIPIWVVVFLISMLNNALFFPLTGAGAAVGFYLTGRYGERKTPSPVGKRIGIIWASILIGGFLLIPLLAETGKDVGFLIMHFVAVGYMISWVLSGIESFFIGLFLLVVNAVIYRWVPSFYAGYSVLGFSLFLVGVYLWRRRCSTR